jgi:hypothetical protein
MSVQGQGALTSLAGMAANAGQPFQPERLMGPVGAAGAGQGTLGQGALAEQERTSIARAQTRIQRDLDRMLRDVEPDKAAVVRAAYSLPITGAERLRLMRVAGVTTPGEDLDILNKQASLTRTQQQIAEAANEQQADELTSQLLGLPITFPGIADQYRKLVVEDLQRPETIATEFSKFMNSVLRSPTALVMFGTDITDPAAIAQTARSLFAQAFAGVFGSEEEIDAAISEATDFINPAYVGSIEHGLELGLDPRQIADELEQFIARDLASQVVGGGPPAPADIKKQKSAVIRWAQQRRRERIGL